MRQHCFAVVPLLFCVLSCAIEKPESHASWAHVSGKNLLGTIVGKIEASKKKILTNQQRLSVCISSERTDFRKEDFVLESKVAIAAWMNEAGLLASDWSLLDFSKLTESCTVNDKQHASVIVMPSVETNIGLHSQAYRSPQMWCVQGLGSNIRCESSSMTLGFGGPSPLELSKQPGSALWSHIEYGSSATSTLSPFVKWVSLRESISTSLILEKKVQVGLLGRLDVLEASGTFEKFVEFAMLLDKYKVKDESPPNFMKTQNFILDHNLFGIRVPVIPRLAAYHVILHELGHQFGMDHADNPSETSTSGLSNGTQSPNIVYEKNSTMAYGEPWFYLTADDKAGIQNVVKAIQQTLKEFNIAQ